VSLVFEEGEGDFEEFVEDGEDGLHFSFAVCEEALGEGLEPWVVFGGHESGHVEDAAKVAVAIASDGGGGADGRTGVMEAWSDAKPGGGGTGIGKMARQLGTEPAGGTRTDAFDLAEAFDVGVEGGGVLDQLLDLGFEGVAFLGQKLEHAGETLFEEGIGGGLEAAGFGLAEGFEFVEATEQTAQELLIGGGRLPGREGTSEPEAGDELGILLIGLVAAAQTAGVVLDAAWVDEMNLETGGVKSRSGQVAVVTRGFEDGDGRGRAKFAAPGEELLETGLGVLELTEMGAGGQEKAGVESVLGDVDAEAGRRRRMKVQESGGVGGGYEGPDEATPGEHRLVYGLPRVKVDLDTIRLRPEEVAGTGADLSYELVVSSRCTVYPARCLKVER